MQVFVALPHVESPISNTKSYWGCFKDDLNGILLPHTHTHIHMFLQLEDVSVLRSTVVLFMLTTAFHCMIIPQFIDLFFCGQTITSLPLLARLQGKYFWTEIYNLLKFFFYFVFKIYLVE